MYGTVVQTFGSLLLLVALVPVDVPNLRSVVTVFGQGEMGQVGSQAMERDLLIRDFRYFAFECALVWGVGD